MWRKLVALPIFFDGLYLNQAFDPTSRIARKLLFEAMHRREKWKAMALLIYGMDCHGVNEYQLTPLYYAIEKQDIDWLQLLIARGVLFEAQEGVEKKALGLDTMSWPSGDLSLA